MKLFKEISDFFLPRNCSACFVSLPSTQYVLCSNCYSQFKQPSKELIASEFKRKFASENIIKDFSTAFIFEADQPIQKIVHELKYNRRFGNGVTLGKMAGKVLIEKFNKWNADFIIPIPLHSVKKAERGFNQAFFIAKGISKVTAIRVKTGVVKRIKFTETQTHLNSIERKQNIRNAFLLKKKKIIEGKNIILVDDVITTGATISECGRVLKNNGATNIFAISAAIADFNSTSFQEHSNQEL
jgi:ComF family protein